MDSGCLKASLLHREVTAQGFTGGYGIVRAFIEQHRARPDLRIMQRPLSPRQVTGWICRHPDNVSEKDTASLRAVLERCPELRTAVDLVRSFGEIMTRRNGHLLADWIHTLPAGRDGPAASPPAVNGATPPHGDAESSA
ncbi:hypothetical protein AB0M36_24765 [Actinoplanes sp. NPDC051346]|uniref:hypothetical protein n=1 Tax=Actinoplanes sp. NPDC051346 TaxID=3155048 RepID=UPI003433C034